MKLFAYATTFLSIMIVGASANPVEQRQVNMKERGSLLRVLAPVAQGRADFDAAVVFDALEKLNANAQAAMDVAALYPAGSDSGETKAAATIWSDAEGFIQANHDYAAATEAAVAAAPQDLASFKAVFGPIGASCGACHEAYRQ